MTERMVLEGHEGQVLDLAFAPDGQTLISAGMDNSAKVWSVPGLELLKTLEGHTKSVNALSLSPDGKTLATASSDQTVKLWSVPDGREVRSLQDRKQVVAAVQISLDGTWVAAGSYGGRARVWTLGGEDVVALKASEKNLSSVAFSPDKRCLVTGGLGPDIAVWDLPSGNLAQTLPGHEVAVLSLVFDLRGRRLLSLGYEKTVRIWNANTWEEVKTLQLDGLRVRGMALEPGGRKIAVGLDGEIQLWALQGDDPVKRLGMDVKAVGGLAFSPDGQWLTAGAADGCIRVWAM